MRPKPSSQTALNRREIIRIGGLSMLGVSLPQLLAAEQSAAVSSGRPVRAKSVVLYQHYGAPSQLESFDPKPDAPAEVRGDFGAIGTSAPGFRVSEIMPKIARVCDRLTVIRSMNHRTANHNPGVYLAITGRTSVRDQVQVGASQSDWPHYGAVLSKMAPGTGSVPDAVQLPHYAFDQIYRCPGQTGGFLGSAYDPLVIARDPSAPDFRRTEFDLSVSTEQLASRRHLLESMDHQIERSESTLKRMEFRQWSSFHDRAFSLLTSPGMKRAFDLTQEPDRIRDWYGRRKTGQSLLAARRLVEAGVRFITVFSGSNPGDGWDTHVDNFNRLKKHLMPPEDQGFAAFIEDLDQRGLLDDTLVVWCGEFGRKPHIGRPNPAVNNIGPGGRDHWPQCYSIALAGAGIRRGFVYSQSDRIGEYPASNPHSPGDLSATIFRALGLDPHAHIHDRDGRPFPLADGEPIEGVFA